MVDGDKAGLPRSAKGARTRARLVEAAKQVFEEDGFHEARISDIADRAGLSHGAFYHYFSSKEEVFREVAARVDATLSAPIQSVILDPESDSSPQERIAKAMRQHLQSYRKEARIIGVIEQMARYDPEVEAARRERLKASEKEVAESIRRLQDRGLADPTLDPGFAAIALGAMTTRFPEMWLAQGLMNVGFDRGAEQLTRLFINALGLAS